MRFAVVTFPGSNCDDDTHYALQEVMQQSVDMLWYDKNYDLGVYDCLVLPGGFSYGDYLRAGAIARFTRIMDDVIEYARNGGLILGICNGFHILLEAGLLPGAMKINDSLKFVCRPTEIRVVNSDTPFTGRCQQGEIMQVPVAHGEGNYYIDPDGLQDLRENKQIVVEYRDNDQNPNGSVANIAGICNREQNIFGLMPHPERCSEEILADSRGAGRKIFGSIVDNLQKRGEEVG